MSSSSARPTSPAAAAPCWWRRPIAAGDPRPSIEERWPSAAAYVAAVRASAERLQGERLLLAEDVHAIIAAAEAGTLARLPAR